MANTAIEIPFYVSKDGEPLTNASAQMDFYSLKTLAGVDKSSSAPAINEISGGWYKFGVAYGIAPFDEGDLVGVIDADTNDNIGLANAERFIPIEVRLDFYALLRHVNTMSQNKTTGDMAIKNSSGNTILELSITESESTLDREPGIA